MKFWIGTKLTFAVLPALLNLVHRTRGVCRKHSENDAGDGCFYRIGVGLDKLDGIACMSRRQVMSRVLLKERPMTCVTRGDITTGAEE
jgi:hypothetical protein